MDYLHQISLSNAEVGRRVLFYLKAVLVILLGVSVPARAAEWSGYIAGEFRFFPESPLSSTQHDEFNSSLIFEPEFYHEWAQGNQSIIIVPFFRLDQNDDERTHFDIREMFWQMVSKRWELRVGIGKVFWGVTESQHLVDIINQTDLVEGPDSEDKLGQPMTNLALVLPWGTLDLFMLPYFRKRTFPGKKGRLRPPLRIDTDRAEYESGAKEYHIDWAVRWSHSLRDFDIGVSHFSGTSREPRLVSSEQSSKETVLVPFYELIDQTGLDLQWTKGSWLCKLEIISRYGQGDRFTALTGGLEYTYVGLFNTAIDLGLLSEYLYDDRGVKATTPFEDDVFMGTRLTFNDVQSTDILAGVIFDTDDNTTFWFLEGSRRLGENWTVDLEVRAFNKLTSNDPLFGFRKDDYLQLQFARHF